MSKTPLLFTSVRLGALNLKNRLVFPAVTTFYNENEALTEKEIRFCEARAKGGAGLITTGMLGVISSHGSRMEWPGVYDAKFIPQMQKLTSAVHAHDSHVLAQIGVLYHWRASQEDPLEVVGPSPVLIHGKLMPRPMTGDEIDRLISQFAQASHLAEMAGFDGIEIVACQGNLLNRFMSTLTNKRDDEYGGSMENRVRLVAEIVRQCKKTAGDRFVVGCRLSVEELMDGGMTIEDYLPICVELQKAGADYLNVEVGWHESKILHLHSIVPPGKWSYLAKLVKNVVDIPVMTAQRINTVALAESILSSGEADIVGMARALIADPDLPNKAKAGRVDSIRPCICCMRCQEEVDRARPLACSVNPEVGNELRPIVKSESRRRVLVVGGGPAGIQAAITAATRGHEVELVESRSELGGYLIEAAIPPGKTDIRGYQEYLKRAVSESGIRVTINKPASLDTLRQSGADVIVLATGAIPAKPDISGIELSNTFSAIEILHNPDNCGAEAVVIGGGLIGLETALFLSERGKKVTVIEMLKAVGADMGGQTRREILERLAMAGVVLETNTQVVSIGENGVNAIRDEQMLEFPADTILFATGLVPNNLLAEQMPEGSREHHCIGDSVSPQKILEAVRDGYQLALSL